MIAGTSYRYGTSNNSQGRSAWVYDSNLASPAEIRVGLTNSQHTNSNGYQDSYPTLLSDGGFAYGNSNRYDGNMGLGVSGWAYEFATDTTPELVFDTRSDGYAYTQFSRLRDDGTVFGRYQQFDGSDNDLGFFGFSWSPDDGFFDLGALVDGGLAANGWDALFSTSGANNLQVAGNGQTDLGLGQAGYLLTLELDHVSDKSGLFSDGDTWNKGTPPTSADDVFIGGDTHTVDVDNAGQTANIVTVGHNGTDAPGSGILNVNNGGNLTISETLNIGSDGVAGIVNVNPGGTLNVNGNTTNIDAAASSSVLNVNGGVFNEAGDLNVGITGLGTANVFNNGIATVNGNINLASDGGSTGNLNINTGGIMNLGGNLTEGSGTGTVTLNSGTLAMANGSNADAGTSLVVDGSGGTINVASGSASIDSTISGNGKLTKSGGGTLRLSQSGNSYAGGTDVNNGTLELSGANNSSSTVGTGTLTIGDGATVKALSHNVFGHSNDNNIPSLVINNGTLTPFEYLHVKSIDMTGGLISPHSNSPNAGSGLDWQHGSNTLTSHAFASAAEVASKQQLSNTFTANVADGAAATDLLFSGIVAGSGQLSKTGDGTLELSNANSYSGGTSISGGTLLLTNASATGTGAVQLNAGTIAGNGGGAGAFTIGDGQGNNDSILAPGMSIGTLLTGSLSFQSDGLFDVELNTDTLETDLVIAAGDLDIAEGAALQLTDLGGSELEIGDSFVLIDYDDTWNDGVFDGLADDSVFEFGDNYLQIDYNDPAFDGSALTLTAVNVPEPASIAIWSILGLCLAGYGYRRRRKS